MPDRDAEKSSDGILPQGEFRDAIRRERVRSDRSGGRFCLVVFATNGENPILERILRERTRVVDRVGRFGGDQVAVLLPKTELEGARRLGEDIVGRLNGGGGAVTFRVLSYPAREAAKGAEDGTYSPLDDELQPACVVPMPFWKRAMDITGAIVGLILLSPILLAVALYIMVVSPGPVIFRQPRVGYKGRPFTFLKFRTMRLHHDTSGHQSYLKSLITGDRPMTKLDSHQGGRDPRLLPGAAIIRKLALDELPQLVNVLRGEMSLVGPRPCIPYEAGEYLRWHTRRFDIVPGLTGLWQVSGKNKLSFKEMIRLDNTYARKISFWLDVKILVMTVPAILVMVGEAVAARISNRHSQVGN